MIKEKEIKISYYVSARFDKAGIVISNKSGNGNVHVFPEELKKILEEYNKWASNNV